MASLFETTEINGMTLKNRFVRSATYEGIAEEDGAVTPALMEMMKRLAIGGTGLIITGHAYVAKEGQAGKRQLGIYNDQLIPGLRDMVDAVHQQGGIIVTQLAHSGLFADPEITGERPFSPSVVPGTTPHDVHQMTMADIQDVVKAFGRAAARAINAGFDGVQIHSAHGYLLSQFLSPYFNRRSDVYGGDLKNRVRMPLEVLQTVRSAVGKQYPVLVKMNTSDFLNGGLSLNDSVAVGELFQQNGIDAIELSGGTGLSGKLNPIRTGIQEEKDEAYFQNAAISFKNKIAIPTMIVGGIRSYKIAEELITSGTADYISLSRPLIREPGLVNRWKSGNREKAACISCCNCLFGARAGKGLHCVVEDGK